jgi:single-strand DNA-binding protein
MASFNRVILMGNLTRDPELRHIPSGTAVAELGIAVNDRIKRNDQWVEETTFVDITLWGRTAEIAKQYLEKGSPVLIEGRLRLETWEKEGQKRSKLKVVGDRMQMIGGRDASHRGGGGSDDSGDSFRTDEAHEPRHDRAATTAPAAASPPADEIPF